MRFAFRRVVFASAALVLLLGASGCREASPREKAHRKVCGAHGFRVLCKRCCKERGFSGHKWVGKYKLCSCLSPWNAANVKPALRVK
ncbi:MAG: hypothetical protein KC503_05405 [Myxococcales bacterium]|nr:hypothetical protein [Myxococcales bacterium]